MIGKYGVAYIVFLGCVLSAGFVAPAAAATTEPVQESLARPAVLTRHPEKVMLLGAEAAGSRWVAVGERGLIVLSDDHGQSWRQASSPVSVTLTAVRFADDRHGMAVGHSGAVLSSSDGGESWVSRLDGRRAAQLVLAAAQARQDARAEREAQWLVDDGPDKPFLDLLMFGRDQVLVVGAYGLAFGSTDGGQHWDSWMDRMDNPRGLHLNAVRRRGDIIVIAGEQGLVLRSEDGGKSFARLQSPYSGSFFTVELPSEHEIVLAGLRGSFWRSQDDGKSWESVSPPIPASIVASALLPGGRILMVNQAGFILEWANGSPLVPVNKTPLPFLTGLLHTGGERVIALCDRGVLPLDLQALSKEMAP